MSTRTISPTMWQAGALFSVDLVTNLTDYAFHVYLGWALAPGQFAIVQTINSVLLILVTTFAVLQPVVARFVAQFNAAAGQDDPPQGETTSRAAPTSRTVFQRYFRQGLWLGLLLFALAWFGRDAIATLLNVPASAAAAAAFILLSILVRPVALGMLQGQQQFVAFGLSRTSYAVSRLLLVLLFVTVLGGGAVAAISAMPLAALLSLGLALILLGRQVWRPGAALPTDLLREGWRLSFAALVGYAAFMALQNIDLIWVNRLFPAPVAGAYATAVVLRRVLAVLPGAVLVILYPRIVAQVASGRLPDALLLKAFFVIGGTTGLLTLFYFLLGPWLLDLMFGPAYAAAAPLLGWMGVAMIAYGLGAIWLNLFLATRPWPFVLLLALGAGLQIALFSVYNQSVGQITAVFLLSGWFVALAGLALYLLWLRPDLPQAREK